MPPGSPTQTPPGPKTVIDHDGTFAVGTDILPGTYTSAGPVQGRTCYWKRTNGSDIIDNAMTKKPQVVQIEPTDKAFKTDGCQPWQKNDAATVDPGKSPAEAKVQLDILNGIASQHGADQPPKP
ncbi:lipoprotein [Mycobacterium xenopi]|uniref:Lipoprotein n=1 Tax=Mycobacterium xenopi TaxID=1789 RepID=A0AAD1H0L3_MYCXE|nr:lipoprotein [Mycobacterium xenopi]SPX92658.1 lipoprotein [Mycobacterium xenopi]